MESSEFDQVVVCPICQAEQPSLFEVTDPISTQDWKCLTTAGCPGAYLLHFGFCQECGDPVVKPWRKDRTVIICEKCNADRDEIVMGRLAEICTRIDEIGSNFQVLIERFDEAKGTQPAAEELTQRHLGIEEAFGKLQESLDGVRRGVESMNGLIAKTQGYLQEDLKASDEQLLTHLKGDFDKLRSGTRDISKSLSELPIGKLTDRERQTLADLISNQLTSSLSLILLGKKKAKDSDELVPAHSDVSNMVRTHLTTLASKPLKELEEAVAKLEHKLVSAVAETAAEALGSARSRGKDDRPVVLSLNLAAMEAFVESAKQSALLTAVKHLPEVFNRIESDLKHQQEEQERAGNDGTGRDAVALLKAVDEYFANWQRQNNIVRFPEKPGEAVVPRLHEIVLTMPTDDRESHRLIGRVEQHGYLLRDGGGELILQKAEVAVWDFGKRE